MSLNEEQGLFKNLRADLPASIIVFLVAMPLCLGIAVASGADPIAGIIAGIVGGIIVGALSGSPLGVSGPAAGLVVIVLAAIESLGYEVFLVAVVIAGVLQLVFGFLKAGVIGYYFPNSVIKGMLAGIGIFIALKQIPHVFGYANEPEGDLAFSQVDGHNTFSELFYMLEQVSPSTLIIAGVSLGILILWERPFMKRIPAFKLIQGPLVAVVAGIVLNLLFKGMEGMALTEKQLVAIPVTNSMDAFLGLFKFPDFSEWANKEVWITAGTLAVVASLETLLCLEATDKLDPLKRVSPTNRELKAQGVGNVVSGLLGGLPVTQVIVRSSTNIQSGGRTKMSAIVHGFLLIGCVLLIPNVLNLIPYASLAAILLVVGYKLAKPALFKSMFVMGEAQYIPFMVTILGIVFTNLLLGIAAGLVVAIFMILINNYKIPYHWDPNSYKEGEPVKIALAEEVTFLNKAAIQRTLDVLPHDSHVIIDATKNKTIHPDVVEIIHDFRDHAKTVNIEFEVIGLEEEEQLFNPVAEFGSIMKKKPFKKKKGTLNTLLGLLP